MKRMKMPKEKEYKCFVCDAKSKERGIPLLIGETTFSRICLGEKLQEILGDNYIVLVSRNDCVCWKCATYINSFDRYDYNSVMIKDFMASRIGNKYKESTMSLEDLVSKEEDKPGTSDDMLLDDIGPRAVKRGRPPKPKRPVGRPSKKQKPRPSLSAAILKVYSCRFCSKKYDTEEDMKAHLTEKHSTLFVCHICDTSFNNLKKYKAHLKTHIVSRKKTHSCVSCGFISKDIETYCRHVCDSNVVSLTCATCRKLFVEVRKEGKPPSTECPECFKESIPPVDESATGENKNEEMAETEQLNDISSKEDYTNQEEGSQAPSSPIVSSAEKEAPTHAISENSSDTALNHLSPQLNFPPSETVQSLESVLVKPSESGENMLSLKSGSISGEGSIPNDEGELNHMPDSESRKDEENSPMDTNEDTLLKTWETDNMNAQQMNCGEEDSNDRACLEDGEIPTSNENVLMRNMYDAAPLSDYPINSYVKCSGCQEEFELSAIPTHACFLEHDVLEYSEVDPPSYLKAKMLSIPTKTENEDSSMSFDKTEMFDEDMGATFYIKEPGSVFVQEGYEANEQQPRRRRRIPRIPALENSTLKKTVPPKLQCKTCGMEFASSSTLREHWDVTGHLREVNLGKHPEVNTFTDKVKKMEMTFKVVKQNFNIKATIPGQNEYVLQGKDDFYKSMFVRNDDGKGSYPSARDEKECSTCCVIFPSVEEMLDHQRFDCLTCLTCNITFLDNKLLKKHYQYTGHSPKRIWRSEEVQHVVESHLVTTEMVEENEQEHEDIIIEEEIAEEEDEENKKEAIMKMATSSEI